MVVKEMLKVFEVFSDSEDDLFKCIFAPWTPHEDNLHEVNNVDELTSFHDTAAKILDDQPFDNDRPEYTMLDRYFEVCNAGHTMASNFGGIGASFTGSNLFHKAAQRRRPGKKLCRVRHSYSIEILTESQNELRILPNGPEMLFDDMNQFWVEPLRGLVREVSKKKLKSIYDILKPIILEGNSVVNWGYDIISNEMRQLPVVDNLEAGTPCVDWSCRGSGDGVDGPSCLAWLSFIALRLLQQEAHVTTENVKRIQIIHYKEFGLSKIYHIDLEEQGWQTTVENSFSFGWPGNRERKWTHFRHKIKTGPLVMPLSIFTKLFYRQTTLTFKDFFVAPPAMLQKELTAACQRKDVAFQGPLMIDAPHAFEKCLTLAEIINLCLYRFHWAGRAWSLNQKAIGFSTTSSSEGRLQAIIKNAHYIWADDVPGAMQGAGRPLPPPIDMSTGMLLEGEMYNPDVERHDLVLSDASDTKPAGRWLIGEECLLAQGFPSLPSLPDYSETSWSVDRVARGIPERSSAVVKMQAGNTMNVNVAMVMHLFGVVCIPRQVFSPFLQNVNGFVHKFLSRARAS